MPVLSNQSCNLIFYIPPLEALWCRPGAICVVHGVVLKYRATAEWKQESEGPRWLRVMERHQMGRSCKVMRMDSLRSL